MNTLKGFDLIDYAVEKDKDFIALVVSPWHMLGVQAVIEALSEEYKELNGTIAICRNGNGNYTIKPELYSNMSNVEFVYYDSAVQKDFRVWNALDLRVKKQKMQKPEKFFLIPNRIDVFLYAYYTKKAKNQLAVCYILDEGLGTYVGLNGGDAEGKKRGQSSLKARLFDRIAERYTDKLIRNKRWNNFSVLQLNEKNEWINNDRSIKYYGKALSKSTVESSELNQMYSDAIVINTQPFMGVGIPEGDVDINILAALCKLCKEKDIKIVIKPHPGQTDLERYAKLEEFAYFDVRKGLSQEEILNSLKNKPRAIVAFSSTTLLTTKLFYDIPSYSLAKLLLEENINEFHKERLRVFIDTFENQICFCDSVNTIIDDMTI